VGLESDGTLVAVGRNNHAQCNVSGGMDIVQVTAGGSAHTVGLKSDGTIVAVGRNDDGDCNVGN
jgi:alpha-tubulin suppressor-like RCC1 family protein